MEIILLFIDKYHNYQMKKTIAYEEMRKIYKNEWAATITSLLTLSPRKYQVYQKWLPEKV